MTAATRPDQSLSQQELRERVARGEADVQRRVADLKGRVNALVAAFPQLVSSHQAGVDRRVAQAQAQASVRQRSETQAALARFEADAHGGRARALQTAMEMAPSWASAECVGDWSTPQTTAPAEFARIGHLANDFADLPLLVPLVNHPGLFVQGDATLADDVTRTLATRFFAQSPLKHATLDVFDPRLRGLFGSFSGLRSAHPASFPQPSIDATSFAGKLDEVMRAAVRNVELSRTAGAASLTDLWRLRGVPEGVLHLIVILDYPYGVDRNLQDRLKRIAAIGGPSGTSLVIAADPLQSPNPEVDTQELTRLLTPVTAARGVIEVRGYPAPAVPDQAVDERFIDSMVRGLAVASQQAQGPTIPLVSLLGEDLNRPWSHSSNESLEAIIGIAGRDPMSITLRTENPPHTNLLVGGAVGQGKSNLVLDIVYALATRYSPAELELHLLDFKRGLEFKRFAADDNGENWLPHAKVLSLESNQEFGVAVLAHVDGEMSRRAQLFKQSGANSLDTYRSLSGAPLPRVLLIIDEFHMLFEGEDHLVDEALEYMERLAKQGRAYGIHLLLASQTTSGVRGLAIKGQSIFAQFPLRMSLKNTPAESQAILSEGNRAAADLTFRGEVVLNRNFGTDPEGSNIRGLAAYAEPKQMAELQARLWQLWHGAPPVLFMGNDYAAWDDSSRSFAKPEGALLEMLVGRPIAVTNVPATLRVERDADQSIAVVGGNAAAAGAALNAMVFTAIPQLAQDGGSLIFLEGSGQEVSPWLGAAIAFAEESGVACSRVPRPEIAEYLKSSMHERLQADGPPTLVVGLGLQRVPNMQDGDQGYTGFEISFDDTTPTQSARSVLQTLAAQGALAGVAFVGWWASVRALEVDLTLAHGGVSRYVTAGLGLEDLRALAGVTTTQIKGSPRIGCFDRNGEGGLRTLVPFDPETPAAVIR